MFDLGFLLGFIQKTSVADLIYHIQIEITQWF